MLLSLNVNKLDFIWHGLHFPNQLPYRYTFVICFVLIGMAYKAFGRLDDIKEKTIWIVLFSGIAYYIFAQKVLIEHIIDMNLFFYGGVAWLILYSAVLLIYKRRALGRSSFMLLVVFVVAAEMISGTCTSFHTIGNTQRDSYFENYKDVTALAEQSKQEFVRTEMDYNYILNCPALYHYRGISQFSSSINADATALMEKIGIEGEPGKNRFNYNQTNPVTNAMLNIKYIITKNLPLKDNDFTEVNREGHSRLYESKYPLSIGYMTGGEIRTWDTHSENPFEVLDNYVRSTTSNKYTKVFHPIGKPLISADNLNVQMSTDSKITTEAEDNLKPAQISLTYKANKTQKYYVFVEADNADEIIVNKSHDVNDIIDIRSDCGSIVNIGEIKDGDSFDIIIKYKEGNAGHITSHVCTLDYKTWNAAYDIISDRQMKVTDSGDNFIKGSVDAGDGGMLVTSIPYEKGWSLKVDGVKKDIHELAGGVFISTSLQEGVHQIELYFRPPGIIAGLIISCISIVLLVVFTLIRKYRIKTRNARF